MCWIWGHFEIFWGSDESFQCVCYDFRSQYWWNVLLSSGEVKWRIHEIILPKKWKPMSTKIQIIHLFFHSRVQPRWNHEMNTWFSYNLVMVQEFYLQYFKWQQVKSKAVLCVACVPAFCLVQQIATTYQERRKKCRSKKYKRIGLTYNTFNANVTKIAI